MTIASLAWLALCATLAPVAVGAVHRELLWPFVALAGIVASLGPLARARPRSARLRRALEIALVGGLSVAGADLLMRPLRGLFPMGEHERFVRIHPLVPVLDRYIPLVRFRGPIYGDLAAMSSVRSDREPRDVAFETDAFGFRNAPEAARRPIDVLLLGDSFAVGNGTSQEATFASRLVARHGVRLYNLAFVGSPWHALLNFSLEADRLRFGDKPLVLWMLFSGNDLDETYGPTLDVAELGADTALERAWNAYAGFRARSPTREAIVRIYRTYLRPTPLVRAVPLLDSGRRLLFHTQYAEHSRRSYDAVVGDPAFPRLREVVRTLEARTHERGLELAVVVAPAKEETYGWVLDGGEPWSAPSAPSGFTRAVGELCSELAIPFLDLAPQLASDARRAWEEQRELLFWFDDTHWNPAGHARVAEHLYRALLAGRR